MAEEQNWQEATNHVLCANHCGFFGNPTTLNLCSKCYKDHRLKQHQKSTAKIAVENSLTPSRHQSESSVSAGVPDSVFPVSEPTKVDLAVPTTAVKDQQRNRCGSCRKRVGLTGFTCRCGTTFCGTHRYPEKHECSFDFKTVGKKAIARENPVVKAAKLEKF
ncbi:hypothetical protein L1987_15883 [Smallanthus sonchifolius]|uniref:Uncharacterized protein n=1 Tax=Smallanthus sonchifolius TaxID=185202 RepID=A0ACB9JAA5_9ASTR|nr:hypothetical protein L1987_15883 [Smallanthus sonchifolius]